MLTTSESRRSNDDTPENKGKAREKSYELYEDSGRAIMTVRRKDWGRYSTVEQLMPE